MKINKHQCAHKAVVHKSLAVESVAQDLITAIPVIGSQQTSTWFILCKDLSLKVYEIRLTQEFLSVLPLTAWKHCQSGGRITI